MRELLIQHLNQHPLISGYEISSSHTTGVQLFYVLNKLETNRYTDNSDLSATIYVDHDGFRGSSGIVINAADSEQSIDAKIDKAVKIAKTVNNPFFALEQDINNYSGKGGDFKDDRLDQIALQCAKTIIDCDVNQDGWLNSIEIFVTRRHHQFINSNKIQREYISTKIFAEVIPTWSNQKEEVELYLSFKQDDDDYQAIAERVLDILKQARLRSIAEKPSDKIQGADVVIKGEMLDLIARELAYDLNFANVYHHSNHYQLADTVVPYNLNVSVKGKLAKAADSMPYDAHGTLIKDTPIITNGKVTSFWGDICYGQYLNYDRFSGNANIVEYEVSDQCFEELKLPYLELCNFSSPQLESNSGYCGGEVRLGLYHDTDGKIIPLSGFSVSTNIYEALKTAEFSQEKTTSNAYHGPKYLRLKNVKIN